MTPPFRRTVTQAMRASIILTEVQLEAAARHCTGGTASVQLNAANDTGIPTRSDFYRRLLAFALAFPREECREFDLVNLVSISPMRIRDWIVDEKSEASLT